MVDATVSHQDLKEGLVLKRGESLDVLQTNIADASHQFKVKGQSCKSALLKTILEDASTAVDAFKGLVGVANYWYDR